MNTDIIHRNLFLARLKGAAADLGRIHVADEKALAELLTTSGTLEEFRKYYYVRHPFEFEWHGSMSAWSGGREKFDTGDRITVEFFRGMRAYLLTRVRPPK